MKAHSKSKYCKNTVKLHGVSGTKTELEALKDRQYLKQIPIGSNRISLDVIGKRKEIAVIKKSI